MTKIINVDDYYYGTIIRTGNSFGIILSPINLPA